jgi:hypothetical protein
MQEQVNALGMKLAEEAEQIDELSAKAIDRPSRDHVHLAPCHQTPRPQAHLRAGG